jgi:hypothetical protein
MIQSILRYLGWDEETKRVRAQAQENLTKAGEQLVQLRTRLQETSRISTTGRTALTKTLSESDFGRQRAAGG